MDKEAENFEKTHHPPDNVTSKVTQSDFSIETATTGKSVTTAEKNLDATDKMDTSVNKELRTPMPDPL